MMKVVIPSVIDNPPTKIALDKEGIASIIWKIENDFSYALLIQNLWNLKEDFILLEQDIIPWPGALRILHSCPQEWCVHMYPFAPNTIRWAMGCIKLKSSLINRVKLGEDFLITPWNQLDGKLIPTIIDQTRLKPHIHNPAFAHIKEYI